MPNLPDLSRGQRWSDQSSTEWRALVEAVAATMNLSVGRGLQIRKSSTGIQITLDQQPPDLTDHDRTVVITRTPIESDVTLTVREAGYIDPLRQPCTTEGQTTTCHYEWKSAEFTCYPPMGTQTKGRPIDFLGDEYVEGSDDVPPKLSTVFHRVHREHEVWVLSPKPEAGGGSGIIPARVISIGVSTISVQPYKRSGVTWVVNGATKNVFLWGDQQGSDFAQLIGDMIPLIVLDGEEYAMQYLWWYEKTPTGTKGDCGL